MGSATVLHFGAILVEGLRLAPRQPWSPSKTGVGALAALSYELERSAAFKSTRFFSTTPPHRAWWLRSHPEAAHKSPQRSNSGRLTG